MFGPLPAIVDRGIGQLERCGDPVASRLKGVGMFPKSVDVTGITGAQVVGPPVSWQTPNGPFNVEHVAAVNAANELLGVLVVTAARLAGRQPDRQDRPGRRRRRRRLADAERPFSRRASRRAQSKRRSDCVLVVAQHDWQAVNVSAKTGRRVAGAPVSWLTSDGAQTVEHLAARGLNNELLVFWWSPAHDWQVVDVTAKTGRSVSQDPTAWLSRNGPMVVEHLGAASPDGTLSVFWWSPAHDWQAINVSAIAGGTAAGRRSAGSPVPSSTSRSAAVRTNCLSTGGRQRRIGGGLTSRPSRASDRRGERGVSARRSRRELRDSR